MTTPVPPRWSPASIPVCGSDVSFPVRRILCIGRNYAAHAREMGADERARPFYFGKSADAAVHVPRDRSLVLPYPCATTELHHEIELVVALASGGRRVRASDALPLVFGYAVGVDLTRRDLQRRAKEERRPWTTGKDFDHAAPMGDIHPVSSIGHPVTGSISLSVNGTVRQHSDLSHMIWSVPEILAELSLFTSLYPGDLVFTGTPAGVGPLQPSDRVQGCIAGLQPITFQIGPPA